MSQTLTQQPQSLSNATKEQVLYLIKHSLFINHHKGKLNLETTIPKTLIVDFQNYVNSFGMGSLNNPYRVARIIDNLFRQLYCSSDEMVTVYLITKTYHKNTNSHMEYFEKVNELKSKYSDKLDIIYMAYLSHTNMICDKYLRNGDDILVLATAYLLKDNNEPYAIISNDKYNKKEDINGFYKFISDPTNHRIISITFD